MSDKISMKMGITKIVLIFLALFSAQTRAVEAVSATDQTPEELTKEAADAATKLSGGLIQIADDKRIEKQIQDSSKFATCQKAFQAKVKTLREH